MFSSGMHIVKEDVGDAFIRCTHLVTKFNQLLYFPCLLHVNIAASSNQINSLNLSVIRKEIAVMENLVHAFSKFCKKLVTMFCRDFSRRH